MSTKRLQYDLQFFSQLLFKAILYHLYYTSVYVSILPPNSLWLEKVIGIQFCEYDKGKLRVSTKTKFSEKGAFVNKELKRTIYNGDNKLITEKDK